MYLKQSAKNRLINKKGTFLKFNPISEIFV